MKKDNAKENIKIAFFLNLVFSVIEAVGGFLTNSISILSDSIHDLGDSISIGVSYLLEKKSRKKSNNLYTYGYLRYSLLGALISSVVLIIGCTLVLIKTVPRLFNAPKINYDAMIIFAIFGTIINGYAAYKTSKGEKHNEKAINLHMMEDVLGWIAVLIGSILVKIFKWYIIDPILSTLIAIYIFYHVYKNLKEVFDIFMEKAPKNIDSDKIKKILEENKSINNVHHIHVWSIDGTSNYMTAHIKLSGDLIKNEIIELKNNIKDILSKENINHVTLEIEYYNEDCKDKKC